MAERNLKSSIVSGLKWNSLSVLLVRGTDFTVQMVLARLLLPDAFGVVGMAMVIIGFLQVVSDMGLFNALVQKKEDSQTDARLSSAFWFLLVLGACIVACFFLFISPLGAAFYKEPRLVPILNALSIYLFFSILTIIPKVILTKALAFKDLVKVTVSGTVISSLIAVVLAFSGFGVWSLVVKYLIASLVLFFSYWMRVNWRPKRVFEAALLKELAGYSTYTQINSIFFFFRSNIDYLVIGKLMSAHVLGIYTLAFTLTEVLRAQLYSILNKVFFPVYSKLQDNPEQIRHYYLKTMRYTAMLTFPVSVFFIGLAEPFISVFFGARWLEAALPLRVLGIASMIFAISGTPAEVLKGIGKPKVSFYLNLCNTFLVALPLIYLGLKYLGITGVAFAVCIHYTTSRLFFHYYMKKYIGITDQDVLVALRKPVTAAAVMQLVVYAVSFVKMPELLVLVCGGLAGGLAYGLFFLQDFQLGLKLIRKI